MIRTHLVKALYRNLLGPKDGPHEFIEEPFARYQVGILTSCFHSQKITDKITLDASEKNFQGKKPKLQGNIGLINDYDAEWPDTELELDGSFTLGISFVVSGKLPKVKICSTWGRYAYADNLPQNMKTFSRKPNYYLTEWLDVDSFSKHDKTLKLVSGNGNTVTMHGAELHLRSTKSGESDKWTVQIFLVNRTQYDDRDTDGRPKRQDETHRIFQPQIRVNVDPDSLVEYLGNGTDGFDTFGSLLYSKRRAKARGFQCGAIWDEVDPESNAKDGFLTFSWPDRENGIMPKETIDEFTCPDVRTEYLPPYSILQPETSARKYDARHLSKQWIPESIRDHINPIAENYREWITEQKRILDKNPDKLSAEIVKVGEKHLQECKKSLEEIERGTDFVCNDERARLSFCFMNSVMSEKRERENGEDLQWREFQMAFILQTVRGVSGVDKANQDLADVLWFPTGGGKTEAYLGITMFAIAYRRLMTESECKDDAGDILDNDGGVNVISRYTLRLLTMQQFQRALGAIVIADLRRVQNWIPEELGKSGSIENKLLNNKFVSGNIWGKSRFSIGLWIGGDSTPTRFAHMPGGNKGRTILNAEGMLLSSTDNIKSYCEPPKGDPAQVLNCPMCKSLLCFPHSKTNFVFSESAITWITKTKKTINELQSIPKSKFEEPYRTVTIKDGPHFSELSAGVDGFRFVRVKMKISVSKTEDLRDTIDRWWEQYVNPNFGINGNSLVSTRAAMPGYFFLNRPGEGRPYDFVIHCTNEECKLNKTKWFEDPSQDNYTVPEAFLEKGTRRVSNSVPISAYTIDEQVYSRCPTFIIATADKFANLPWDPRCSSLFGNIDCHHRFFGFGRRSYYRAPLLIIKNGKSMRMKPEDSELKNSRGFLPPSMIIQDELHLIEGPLGSMVGVYEMAIDALSRRGDLGPKYIASSATIKESDTQIRTIFRRNARIFPHPGISSADNFFARTDEDASCTKDGAGRLYVGVCSAKSVFELPIKICAVIMSEIHKIRESPEQFGIKRQDVENEVDPYWTYVSYFSDLQLMSRFGGFYSDDIERDVKRFSPIRIGTTETSGIASFAVGTRIFPVKVDRDMALHGISIYCKNTVGKIAVSLYDHNGPNGNLLWSSKPKKCSNGENSFDSNESVKDLKNGDTVWIGIINDDANTNFKMVRTTQSWHEILKNPLQDKMEFPPNVGKTKDLSGDAIQIEVLGRRRILAEKDMIQLSSETSSEDLPKHLEELQEKLRVDALLTSPVFGTGIDVDRLGLMNIMTQPKTTSGYIQATGRVGRKRPGLVVTWFSSRRARDLDHYENFVGYHRKIHSYVEPVTANPFSEESLELSLGPIIVSILRNGRRIQGTRISPDWIDDLSNPRSLLGPRKILTNKNGDSPEIQSVRKFLTSISSNFLIPEFRRNDNFDHITGVQLKNWLRLVENLPDKEIIYGERNPTRPADKDVILGSPFHEQRGFTAAFHNTRNSLRDTESTAMFHHQLDKIPIRPSQFITRYGPGSLLPADACSVVSPSVENMVSDLIRPIGNFAEVVDGRKELKKIEIHDSKMIKMLRRFNRDVDPENIHIFEMPTNQSLNSRAHPVAAFDNIYKSRFFPEWATCSRHIGDRTLSKIIHHPTNGKLVVRCPECQTQFNDMYSTSFTSVRFVMACKNGHMSDVEWSKLVHKHKNCDHSVNDDLRVFIWDETGGGDDIGFNCYGVWTGVNKDKFVKTKCNAQTKYSQIKHDSSEGFLECKKTFVEEPARIDSSCNASAKIARKSMMSLRSPIILSSLVIQQKKSKLFDKLFPHRITFVTAKLDIEESNKDWQPKDLAEKLESRKSVNQFGDLLIQDIKNEDKQNLLRIADELENEINRESSGQTSLTENQELEEELRNLENGIADGSKQTIPHGGATTSKIKFPVRWKSKFGFNFEAMPFSDIKVTMVQTGYSREITETLEEKESDESKNLLQLRKGITVSEFSRFTDRQTKFRWYIGNQSIGEGIFIHFDPQKHKDDSMFTLSQQTNASIWNDFHKKINEIAEKELKLEISEEQRDLIESAKTKSNPLFVWWHTLAHQIVSGLAIDSGFATTALKERVYCIQKSDGSYSTGILLYVSAPGSDGTLGGMTSLADSEILPTIVDNAMERLLTCSNDPVCSERKFTARRHRGAACHACIMAPETSCSYQNKFLDRNLIKETLL